jgi:raffinose/stachyose/melibiose transport system substrate-binding protein
VEKLYKKILIISLAMVVILAISVFGISCKTTATAETTAAETTAAEAATTAAETTAIETTAEVKPVKLVVWIGGQWEFPGVPFNDWFAAYGKQFEAENPGVTVEQVNLTDDVYLQQLQSAGEAKSGPDITFLWPGIFAMESIWQGFIAPLNDLIPMEEMKHYIGWDQRLFEGNYYGVGHYDAGKPLFYNKALFRQAGIDDTKPPATWDEFLTACEKLKAAGITPVGMGVKDWYGGIITGFFCAQDMTPADLMEMSLGKKSFTDPKFLEIWKKHQELYEKGYVPEEVTTLGLWQGYELFDKQEAAMIFGVETNVDRLIKLLGADVVGVGKTPKWGTGPFADGYVFEQQALGITSWSPNKELAAKYLTGLHKMEVMADYYNKTGILPPDDRFDSSIIKSEQQKQIWDWTKTNISYWGEDFYPTMVDGNAAIPMTTLLMGGQATAEDVVKSFDDEAKKWRDTSTDMVTNFETWMKDYSK